MSGKVRLTQKDLKLFFQLFLPKSNTERVLFFGLFVFYICISIYIALHTSIIDNKILESDLYFSYDNPMVLKYGRTQMTGHPLMVLFFYPFVIIGNLLALVAGFKVKTLLFVGLCSSLISMSCVYVYRYIYEIIEVKWTIALLFTLFFSFFSTNLILAFTAESFTLSAFFLSFSAYYYAFHIKRNTSPSFLSSAILSCVCLGGVTVTNFSKGVIPVLFLKKKVSTIIAKVVGLGLCFFGLLLAVHLFLYFIDGRDYFSSILGHRGTFTAIPYESNLIYWKQVFSKFFGGPIFLPEVINNTFFARSANRLIRTVDVIDYAFAWQYLYIAILSCLLIISFIWNCRNKFVQILFLLLSVDIVIHCVMKFGLDWPFIYGAHWVYCIPLVLAWLYKKLREDQAKIFVVLISVLFAGLFVNNLVRMVDFIYIAGEMFPLQ